MRVSPEQFAALLDSGIEHSVLIQDLQAHIDAWHAENQRLRQLDDPTWYNIFRNLAEIEARVDQLAAAHPGLVTVSVIGQSLEERPIRMMRITGPGATTHRPAIVINGTQHSRESLSPMTTMYFAEQLLTQYATDPRIQALVNGIDFYIVPMVNPDGYSFVWTNDPLCGRIAASIPAAPAAASTSTETGGTSGGWPAPAATPAIRRSAGPLRSPSPRRRPSPR
jgi:murein tripeptide amidase MpaA